MTESGQCRLVLRWIYAVPRSGGEDLSPPGGPLVLLPGETPSTSALQREEKNLGDVFVFPFSRLVF